VTLDTDRAGKIYTKCQVTDYICRGEDLETFNVLQFFVNTWEDDVRKQGTQPESLDSDMTDQHRRPGRRPNQRVPYLSDHPNHGKKTRVMRSSGHNTLPNFIGRYFPRRDDPTIYSFYCACMLLLLKPWRDIGDLKSSSQTWESAFEDFVSTAPKKMLDIMSGIQYFHECESATQMRPGNDANDPGSTKSHHQRANDVEYEPGEDIPDSDEAFTEVGLASLIASQTPFREECHGRIAVMLAKQARIFSEDNSSWTVQQDRTLENATGAHISNLMSWKEQMEVDVNSQNSGFGTRKVQLEVAKDGGTVTRIEGLPPNGSGRANVSLLGATTDSESALTAVDPALLKPDQFRAYDIIVWHLDQTLAGKEPPPLRMIIHGEGGTGKSKVIQTVTDAFTFREAMALLLKAAYTGVAASIILGKTLHFIGHISVDQSGHIHLSDETKAKLQAFWKDFVYLIIDECSMLSKSFLAKLSRHIGIGKEKPGQPKCSDSFGGINVIFCGDFHQFPPVATAKSEALYHPARVTIDSIESQLGRAIYEEFKTVVILREQVRVTDEIWRDFLVHLRHGRVKEHHLKMLRTLIVGTPNCLPTDFSQNPWDSVALVTPRHAVRKSWNEAALRRHCRNTGVRLYVCPAEDKIKGRDLSLAERYGLAARGSSGKRKRKKDLPDMIEIAIGAKVLVTQNIDTDLDVMNGARGEIVDIVLHPDEPPFEGGPIIKLKYLPAYILVKMERTRATKLEGLDEGIIPIEPASHSIRISVRTRGRKYVTRSVTRRQFPMTAAYAFTDYRSQGQTIPVVMVDVAKPPTGKLDLFNLYVALSRSSGRSTIRLLRDFEDEIFKSSHCIQLMEEDDRLETLDRNTKEWWEKMGRG
jgi:hypothetical protein